MKKIIIILSLFLTFNYAQAVNVSELIDSAKKIWNKEKQITLPDFSLTDLNGNVHTKESTKGKYLVVNFWATWCPPCVKEIPAFVKFYDKHSDKVQVLGLDFEQTNEKIVARFTQDLDVNYPIIIFDEKNGPQFSDFGSVLGMPTTYVYDTEGKLIDFRMGEVNIDFLEKSTIARP